MKTNTWEDRSMRKTLKNQYRELKRIADFNTKEHRRLLKMKTDIMGYGQYDYDDIDQYKDGKADISRDLSRLASYYGNTARSAGDEMDFIKELLDQNLSDGELTLRWLSRTK